MNNDNQPKARYIPKEEALKSIQPNILKHSNKLNKDEVVFKFENGIKVKLTSIYNPESFETRVYFEDFMVYLFPYHTDVSCSLEKLLFVLSNISKDIIDGIIERIKKDDEVRKYIFESDEFQQIYYEIELIYD